MNKPIIDKNGKFIYNEDNKLEKEYDNLFNKKDKNHKKYFKNLSIIKKKEYIDIFKFIKSNTNIPLDMIVINSNMNSEQKKLALNTIHRLNNLDKESGEYNKLNQWINELIKIPFGNYISLPVNIESTLNDKQQFLIDTNKHLNKAVYGHHNAKNHILQVISKWITNKNSGGNILAIQGPMGNGKTTLVKEGIANAINRPFSFIALGGTSDVSYFNGHGYTYEGSRCGKIVDILKNCKCMNPIIYFDELDKVSDTYKGQEIIHMLTHITDASQNSLFVDNYFHGVHIDLSKVLFIFSFNDESKIDRILKDRMYVINTNGYNIKDKIIIANDYLIPKLLNTYNLVDKISLSDDIIDHIINNYTHNEEGVRNLNRCIETIISKFNIYTILKDSNNDSINLNYKFNIDKYPYILTIDEVDLLLKKITNKDKPPENMYV